MDTTLPPDPAVPLPATVEPAQASQSRMAKRPARTAEEEAAIDRVIDMFNALHAEHGLLSDEFPSF